MKSQDHKNSFIAVILNILICVVIYLGIVLYPYVLPISYNYFISEDGWAEYYTFVSYFMAGLLLLWSIKKDRSLRQPGVILLCLGLFFVAMEEISWGQRFFNIRTPYFLAQSNFQSELTLHNASFFPAEKLLFFAIIIWAVLIPLVFKKFKTLDQWLRPLGIPLVDLKIQPYFILGFLLKKLKPVIGGPEIGECLIGLGFLLFSIDLYCSVRKRTDFRFMGRERLNGLVIITSVVVTTLIVLLGPADIYALKRHLHKSATKEYPDYGMNSQAKKIFEYLIHHEELKNDDTLFQYGLFLKKMNKNEASGIFWKALQEARGRMLKTPDKPAPNILAGKILKELNQPDLAQKEFTEALRKDQIRFAAAELDWQRTDALKSMGETYIEMGKNDLAMEHLQKAFDYADDGWTKAKIKNLLETISPR